MLVEEEAYFPEMQACEAATSLNHVRVRLCFGDFEAINLTFLQVGSASDLQVGGLFKAFSFTAGQASQDQQALKDAAFPRMWCPIVSTAISRPPQRLCRASGECCTEMPENMHQNLRMSFFLIAIYDLVWCNPSPFHGVWCQLWSSSFQSAALTVDIVFLAMMSRVWLLEGAKGLV